jgi:hypothetical protein
MPFKGLDYVPPPLPPAPPTYPKRQVLTLELSRNGQTLSLPLSADVDDHVWCVGPEVEGLDLPVSDLIQQSAAGLYGSFDVGLEVPPRDLFLPVQVRAIDMEDWFAKRDIFNDLTRPYNRIPVRVTSTRPNGVVRWIDGHRVRTSPTWGLGNWVPRAAFQKFGCTIVCPDPWWRGEDTVRTWAQQGVVADFFPITPVRLSPSRVFGLPVQIQVNGQADASPEWTAEGPFTSITATHVETGRTWTLTGNVLAGQTVVIQSDPRRGATSPRVQGPAGTSWWSKMTPPVDLWTVSPGLQTILVEVAGTDAGTKITMRTPSLWETV